MDRGVFIGFMDELQKIAFLTGAWEKVNDLNSAEKRKQQRRVDYFFSGRAGNDKWDKFSKNIKSPEFLKVLSLNPQADDKLKFHAQSMHELANGEIVGKVQSQTSPGKSYEVRKLSGKEDAFGCTCNDWRFKGSINPGYECKHILAIKEGKHKVGTILPLLARRFWEGKLTDDVDTIINAPRFDRGEFRRSQL
jgi:hypothetical protein